MELHEKIDQIMLSHELSASKDLNELLNATNRLTSNPDFIFLLEYYRTKSSMHLLLSPNIDDEEIARHRLGVNQFFMFLSNIQSTVDRANQLTTE